jgi:DNA-binding GntR family transcriptional regulator
MVGAPSEEDGMSTASEPVEGPAEGRGEGPVEGPGEAPDEVVDRLRAAIHEGEFVPNQRLVEADLSVRFAASRAAVRTALVQLAAEGLVERVQNRGARVRAVSLAEAIEISEVRMVVEGLCAAKAAERATDEDAALLRGVGADMQRAVEAGDVFGYSELNRRLHAAVRSIGGQSVAADVLERLRGQNVRHQFRLALLPGRASVSLPQHLEIVEAVCARDPARAEAAMRAHLASVIETLPQVGSSPGA